MTKKEIQKRVLQNGKPLDLNSFSWDNKTKTFSSKEDNLILDFNYINSCTFNTGSYCTFKTDSHCTFNTGSHCTFNTCSNCIGISDAKIIDILDDSLEYYISVGICFTDLYRKKDTKQWYIKGTNKTSIVVDGIVSEIISQKGNVYKIINIGSTKESYLITNGTEWSHGDTLEQAKESLMYKVSNRDTSAYKDYTLNTVITLEEGIRMYRVITGACESGVKDFVQSLSKLKKKYSIKEIIVLTEGQFNNQLLKDFFNKYN